jgi:hypothetical protein
MTQKRDATQNPKDCWALADPDGHDEENAEASEEAE